MPRAWSTTPAVPSTTGSTSSTSGTTMTHPSRPAPRRLLPALLLACATALPAAAETAPAPAAILRAVAQPAPSHTGIGEGRQSATLRNPLRGQGQYRRAADGRLVPERRAPYGGTATPPLG